MCGDKILQTTQLFLGTEVLSYGLNNLTIQFGLTLLISHLLNGYSTFMACLNNDEVKCSGCFYKNKSFINSQPAITYLRYRV
jgi:hypothetical protein